MLFTLLTDKVLASPIYDTYHNLLMPIDLLKIITLAPTFMETHDLV